MCMFLKDICVWCVMLMLVGLDLGLFKNETNNKIITQIFDLNLKDFQKEPMFYQEDIFKIMK